MVRQENEEQMSVSFSGRTQSSVREEKLYNPRLTKPEDEFVKIMETLGESIFIPMRIMRMVY